VLRARREAEQAVEVRCDGCARTVPRLQTARCASCKRTFCRLCVRWYGHFMLVCEECRAAEW
jgi:hypothetical protein